MNKALTLGTANIVPQPESEWLRTTYLHERYERAPAIRSASEAIARARAVRDSGRAYHFAPRWFPAVAWDANESGLAHVQDPAAAGLRYVGRVVPETPRRDIWDRRGNCGWHTDPHGDTFKDGTGLCFGVVYQLPGRDGRPRFVAGYQFGGTDAGPSIDLGRIFEGPRDDYAFNGDVLESAAAQEAARDADTMAQRAAESELEYQTAWAAGQRWAEKQEEIARLRREIIDDVAARRAVRSDIVRLGHTPLLESAEWTRVCAMITDRVQEALNDILELRTACRALARGDFNSLVFYPDSRLKDAFCEGAGVSTFPNV